MTSASRPSAWGPIIGPLAAIALLIGLLAVTAPAHAAFPGANGKIAFASNRDGNNEVYAMNPDGTGQTNLTTSNAQDFAPAWSPDGTKIAFTSDRDGDYDIYTMDADGRHVRQVTNDADGDLSPSWSPDGTKIVYSHSPNVRFGGAQVYVINANGTGRVLVAGGGYSLRPNWSPDGAKIAYDVIGFAPNDVYDIHTVNPDGTGDIALTDGFANHESSLRPSWTPNGTRIAFYGNRGADAGLFTISRDGGDVMHIAGTGASDFEPSWSPDGQKIVFTSNRDGNSEIYVMDVDGSNQMRLTINPAFDSAPDWQPVNPAPYPRPIGASPTRMPLVPAFVPCDGTDANATHAAPLSGGSCNPPVPRSALVAVGSLVSSGFARMIVLQQGQCAPFDSTHCYPDFSVKFFIRDIRSGSPTGPDYETPSSQDLTGILTLPGAAQGTGVQVTDKNSQSLGDPSGPYDKSATTVPFSLAAPISCTPLSGSEGSVCDATTTINTLAPGAAVAGKRAIWELGQLQVLDQGANGVPGDSDDQAFEVQGVFVP